MVLLPTATASPIPAGSILTWRQRAFAAQSMALTVMD